MAVDGGAGPDTPVTVDPPRPEISIEQSADLLSSRIPRDQALDPVELDPVELDPVELDPVELDPIADLKPGPVEEPRPGTVAVSDIGSAPRPGSAPAAEPTRTAVQDVPPRPADPYGQGPLVSDTREGPLIRTDTVHDRASTALAESKAVAAASDPAVPQTAVDVGRVALEVVGVNGVEIRSEEAAGPVSYAAQKLQGLGLDNPSPISEDRVGSDDPVTRPGRT